MPALDLGGRPVSFFEFWPSWLMYLPVAIQCLLLGLRHRSMSLPLIANPAVPLSGMAGVPKSAILQLAGQSANQSILPWITITTPTTPHLQSQEETSSNPAQPPSNPSPTKEKIPPEPLGECEETRKRTDTSKPLGESRQTALGGWVQASVYEAQLHAQPERRQAALGGRMGPGASREGSAPPRGPGPEHSANQPESPNPAPSPEHVTSQTEITQSAFLEQTLAAMKKSGLDFPIVGKPDIGCRGAGVKLLPDSRSLDSYLKQFPPGAAVLLQKLSDFEPEAGVFYVRDPKTETGGITSLTLKYTPYVVGDGVRTLAELVAADPRARGLTRLYEERNARHWGEVLPEGRPHRLVFSASHCRGAVFRDGGHLITRQLTGALDRIFDDIPGFYYGRLDLKFRDVDSLRAGRDLQIVEINGASSESIHIWDRKTGFFDAVKTLLQQYRTLFTLGLENKRRGCKPPGLWPLYRAWRHELQLVKRYPVND